MDILKKIEHYREEEEKLKWEGTFAQYLDLLKEKPWVGQSAHSRVFNMIKDAGVEEVEGKRKYKFFSNQLFGLEEALERLVEEYFHPAAKRVDVRKRILLLMGPVSGGKSTLVSMLKRGLEQYSRTERGGVFSIKGCPQSGTTSDKTAFTSPIQTNIPASIFQCIYYRLWRHWRRRFIHMCARCSLSPSPVFSLH